LYDEQDFNDLLVVVGDLKNLIVLPNVWTEVDNLLHKFSGENKYLYVENLKNIVQATTEKFIASVEATKSIGFYDLGITDALLLEYAKECKLLITGDSALSDYAIANGTTVYDLVKNRNERL